MAGHALAERVDTLVRRQEERLGSVLGDHQRACFDETLTAVEALVGLPQADRGSLGGGTGGCEGADAKSAPIGVDPVTAPDGGEEW